MLEIISTHDEKLKIYKNYRLKSIPETNIYIATYDGQVKIIKLMKNIDSLNNRLSKIELLKDRLNNFKEVVTADAFICDNGKIIGYIMPYTPGKKIYTPTFTEEDNIIFLKNISEILKRLHKLNIVVADLAHNIVFTNDNQIRLINHDNFSIDNYGVEAKPICLNMYEHFIKDFDEKFDNYALNIYTIATFKNMPIPYIYAVYQRNPSRFNFKDEEIKEIFEKTMNLENAYNEDLIIDKINSVTDLKKVKIKN